MPLDSRSICQSGLDILDSRHGRDKEEFREFIHPLHRFMNETTDRVPMSDFINTDTTTHRGFRARSVVGAFYMKLLEEKLNAKNNENKK